MDATQTIPDTTSMSELITSDLLVKAVSQKEEDKTNIRLDSFTVSPGSQSGDNYVSITLSVRAVFRIRNREITRHLFFKLPHREGFFKDWLRDRVNLFTVESRAYCDVIPAMVDFQIKRGLEPVGPSVPMHYYSEIEANGGLIVLEDLRPQGYTLPDRIQGLDEAHCKLVMKELASFHALAFAIKNGKPQNMKKFDTALQESVFASPFPHSITACIQTSLSLVKDLTNDKKIIAAAEKLKGMDLERLLRDMIHPEEPYAVICHGDLWCNNTLFKYDIHDGIKTPVNVKLIDFQGIRYALPTTDLTYFFYSSTTRTTRKECLKALLTSYHSHFKEVLKRMDMDFPEFTLEVLGRLFKQSALLGIAFSCLLVQAMFTKPDDAPDLSQTNEETAAEYMSEQVKRQFSLEENHPRIRERLIGGLEEAVEMGVL